MTTHCGHQKFETLSRLEASCSTAKSQDRHQRLWYLTVDNIHAMAMKSANAKDLQKTKVLEYSLSPTLAPTVYKVHSLLP